MAELENQPDSNEQESVEFKEYTEPVKFVVDNNEIFWNPQYEGLSALPGTLAREIAESVEELIVYLDDGSGYIVPTPEGPFLPSSVKNLYTVVWAFNELYGDEGVKVVGNAPTLEDMGLDEASNYDENGKEIVR